MSIQFAVDQFKTNDKLFFSKSRMIRFIMYCLFINVCLLSPSKQAMVSQDPTEINNKGEHQYLLSIENDKKEINMGI